jgi:hypothetical protein
MYYHPSRGLFAVVCKKLAAEGTPVLWIFDSLNALFRDGLTADVTPKLMACSGAMYEIFQICSFLSPYP